MQAAHTPPPSRTPSSSGAWVAAAIVIVISVLSTFTLSKPGTEEVSTTGPRQGGGFVEGDEFVEDGEFVPDDPLATDTGSSDATSGGGSGGQQSRVVRTGTGGKAVSSGAPGSGSTDSGAAGTGGTGTGGTGTGGSGTGGTATKSGGGTSGGTATVDGKTYDCAKKQNAGASDVGVSSGTVQFAATIVRTGIAKEFLAEAQIGMEAVIRKVNRTGICGRLLRVKYDDDGWVPSRGQQYIRGYISEKKYFGLAVNPSSEGLKGAIDSGDIDKNGFPVIGADGMLLGQYTEPWVWPVATSTHSIMHIMCKDAYDRGARSFGIVWEGNYRFGVEGHDAFAGCVKRLPGSTMVADQELQGGQLEYPTQANSFVGKCSNANQDLGKCDFVALLLEPATADAWRKSNGMSSGETGKRPKYGFGAPQPLFIDSFAKGCGPPCANLRVWTSFKPPIDPFDKDPAVQTYLAELRAVSSSADASNPHVQGAYVGMKLVVHVLEKMGPEPTRAKAKEILDSTTLDTQLGPPLTFKPGNHFAATSAQAFEAVYNFTSTSATFTGWRYAQTGFKNDTEVDKDR